MNNIDRLKLEVTKENTGTDNAIETLKNLSSTISDGVEAKVRGGGYIQRTHVRH